MKSYFKKSCCSQKSSQGENFFWNMMGSTFSSLTSVVFSIIVARICLPAQSDAFSIAYAIAVQIWTVANFESGTLMVTDTKNKYSADEYFSFKTVLLALSLMVTGVVLAINIFTNRYDAYKSTVVALFCLYRIAEALSNHYYSVFQKNEHINIAGFSMFARTLVSLTLFSAVLLITQNLILAISVLLAVCLLWVFLYEKNFSNVYGKTRFNFNISKTAMLFFDCTPLFLCSFLISYLMNIPKYLIDSVLAESSGIQTAYNAIFQPAAIINLFCLFVFRPAQTTLARRYNDGEYKKYIMTALKIFLATLAFAAVALLAAAFLGIPVLQLFYGKQYIHDEYVSPLLFVIIGGVFYAVSQLLYNMITVIRCQHFMLIGYAVTLAATLSFAKRLVLERGIYGAAMVYMLSMALLTILFLVIFAVSFGILKRKQTSEDAIK